MSRTPTKAASREVISAGPAAHPLQRFRVTLLTVAGKPLTAQPLAVRRARLESLGSNKLVGGRPAAGGSPFLPRRDLCLKSVRIGPGCSPNQP